MTTNFSEFVISYISDKADIGIRAIDKNGKIIYCNRKMEEILGIKKEDMLNKYIFDVHKDLEGSSSTLLNCLRTGKPINNKVKMQLNNKGVAAYNIVTNIPIIKDDEIIGAIEYIKTEDSYAELLKYIEN
ncbi:MAG: PAS domain-containing protein, partial [Tissierellia bacterium]|nr:PAS domain-containing protein [Tissierellia bacterium]